MRGWAFVLIGAALWAQPAAPEAALRGVLLDWDAAPGGDLSVRVRDNHVYCYRFDGATVIERGGLPASLMDLRKGDTVEVVAGPGPNPRLPRARAIRVLTPQPQLPARRAYAPRDFGLLDDLFPRGNLTYAGVVTGLGLERVVLQTRAHGRTEILLRQDTRFVFEGRQVEASALRVNARIFIRAARNLDGAIEAYQVMWGDLLRPPPQ